MRLFTLIAAVASCICTASGWAQQTRSDELILELERADQVQLREAAGLLMAHPGVTVVALSAKHQVILLHLDDQKVEKETLLRSLWAKEYHVREKYGTIAQVLDNLGEDFMPLEMFQPRTR